MSEKGAYPDQPQGAYPTQPQGGYPTQPQGAYPAQPQGAYPPEQQPPPQGYDQQPPPYQPSAYPQAQGYPQVQAAPPYTQDQQRNVTVVMHQPAPAVATIEQPRRRPEFGIGALVFAIMSTIFIASFMCWWSLPFTIVGIVLGITSSTSGDSGDLKTAKTHAGISIGCTAFGWFSALAGLAIIVGSIIGAIASANS